MPSADQTPTRVSLDRSLADRAEWQCPSGVSFHSWIHILLHEAVMEKERERTRIMIEAGKIGAYRRGEYKTDSE